MLVGCLRCQEGSFQRPIYFSNSPLEIVFPHRALNPDQVNTPSKCPVPNPNPNPNPNFTLMLILPLNPLGHHLNPNPNPNFNPTLILTPTLTRALTLAFMLSLTPTSLPHQPQRKPQF